MARGQDVEEARVGWGRTAAAVALVGAALALTGLPAAVAAGLVPAGGAIAALVVVSGVAIAAAKGAAALTAVVNFLSTFER